MAEPIHAWLVHAAVSGHLTQQSGPPRAFGWGDLNPLKWLGAGASQVAADAWKSAMIALWSAGLWILDLAFKIIDAFTTPDLSTDGPMGKVFPYTFAIGGAVAVLMAFIQIGVAAFRRDGQSLARVMVGVCQFGAVWIGYVTIAALLVVATSGLTQGLLQGLLHVDAFSGFSTSQSWPRKVDDTVVATVLGLCTVFLIFPAAIGYVVIMLVREAALMLITATAAISAAGLLSEGTRSWFWKTLRWFIAALLIAPLAALVLGIGVVATNAVVHGDGESTTAAVGMAVVGTILILIGAVCPLILFRLLAFVDPGTASGAAMRTAFAANGGVAGLLSGKTATQTSGGGTATHDDGHGRSQGEASADTVTQGRFAAADGASAGAAASSGGGGAALGAAGGVAAASAALQKVIHGATTVGADVLGAAGIGHHQPYYGSGNSGPGSPGSGGSRSGRSSGSEPAFPAGDSHEPDGPAAGGDDNTPAVPPPPPPPPLPQPRQGLAGSAGGPEAAGEAGTVATP